MLQIDLGTSQVYRTVQIVNLGDNDLCTDRRMARRTKNMEKKKQKGKRKLHRRSQSGGRMPWMVDIKKGIEITKNLIRDLKKPVDHGKAKRLVRSYKEKYQEYKRRGGSKSYNSWIIDNGYGTRNSDCCIQ